MALFTCAYGPLGQTGDASATIDFARLMTDFTRDLPACVHLTTEPSLPRLR
jgi:hypothetical protein